MMLLKEKKNNVRLKKKGKIVIAEKVRICDIDRYMHKWKKKEMKLLYYGVPGSAINASACLAISALRWCMPDTALTSPTLSPVILFNPN